MMTCYKKYEIGLATYLPGDTVEYVIMRDLKTVIIYCTYTMYNVSIEVFNNHFYDIAVWRNKQIDSILD